MKTSFEAILAIVGLIVLAGILFAVPLQLLWNWLMPKLFSVQQIDIYQAMGINFLANILFKSNVTIKRNGKIS